jgi:hypothetical protein
MGWVRAIMKLALVLSEQLSKAVPFSCAQEFRKEEQGVASKNGRVFRPGRYAIQSN